MRISIAAAFIVLASAAASRASDNGNWCRRDFGDVRGGNCGFYSAEQCLSVVRIAGGICERRHVDSGPPRDGQGGQARNRPPAKP